MSAYVSFDPDAGASIQSAAREAIGLADSTGLPVYLKFNETIVIVCHGDEPMFVVETYNSTRIQDQRRRAL